MSSLTLDQQLHPSLKALSLPTVRACYREQADLARRETLSYERYLLELLERERESRQQNRIARRLRESRLPLEKTLHTFDAQVSVLLEGEFTRRRQNVLAFGHPGTGKTHLLCAIAHELVLQGQRVIFTPAQHLVQDLLIARRELTLTQRLKHFARYDALVIDDIGYIQQTHQEMEVLFVLLADCYERTSLMITSQLPFSQWETIFKDPMTTAAAIDRLIHHSIILELTEDSYRLAQSKQHTQTPQETD